MPTLRDLHEMHLRRLDSTLAESELLLQREGGLDGELKTSGAICERFVKDTLRKFMVPRHFRITSGFIATPEALRTNVNLPQCDLMIVDQGIPPLIRFEESDIEVVPREAVCGVIEVKRTLTKSVLVSALNHIDLILATMGDCDSMKVDRILNKFNRNIGFHNHSSNKPLVGVIALQNRLKPFQLVPDTISSSDSLVDFVWSFDGHAVLPGFADLQYFAHTARPAGGTWGKLTAQDFASAESGFHRSFAGKPDWVKLQGSTHDGRAGVFAVVLGVVSLMLSRVTASPMQEAEIANYYIRR